MRCPLCGKKIKDGRLRAHKEEEHGEANVPTPKPKLKPNAKPKEAAQNDVVQCTVCSKKIKRKNLESHKRSKHPTKRQKLDSIFGPDDEALEELKKRRIFVSGGGFGVGRGKRR
jgi:ribosomal protein L28